MADSNLSIQAQNRNVQGFINTGNKPSRQNFLNASVSASVGYYKVNSDSNKFLKEYKPILSNLLSDNIFIVVDK